MNKRKLKGFVLPTVYIMVIGILFISISFIGSALQSKVKYDDNLSVNALEDNVTPVIKNEEETNETDKKIVKPFTSTAVSISKSYYDMQDDEKTQQNSLVYYENTYLQNSGVLYSSKEAFDILSVYDGTVTNISEDENSMQTIISENESLKSDIQRKKELLEKLKELTKENEALRLQNKKLNDEIDKIILDIQNHGHQKTLHL